MPDNLTLLTPPSIWLVGLFSYALGTSITPGPNNTISAVTGANFGFRAGLPHVFGVAFGFAFLLLLSNLGVAAFLLVFPAASWVLKFLGISWLLWLAFKLLRHATLGSAKNLLQPMRFHQSALFQLYNPKAWVMALGVSTNFVGQNAGMPIPLEVLYVFIVFSLVNIPCQAIWVLIGFSLRNWLKKGQRLRIFNATMGLLLAATAVGLLLV